MVLEPDSGGGYTVICPAIPGCVSEGNSLEEALVNMREAVILCFEVRRESGLPPVAETLKRLLVELCFNDHA